MKIPSTKGLEHNFQKLDRSAKEKKHGITAEMMAAAETLIKVNSGLNRKLSGPGHNREFRNHLASFII
jgi:hypothetical protein